MGEEEEEEARARGEDAALMAIREAEEAPSGAAMSLFISSLLLRVTAQEAGRRLLGAFAGQAAGGGLTWLLPAPRPEMALVESMLETLCRAEGGRLVAPPLRRCSAVDA